MRIVVQSFAQVLDSQNLRLVLSFAQYIFRLAPTKNATSINSILSVLVSFWRLSFSPQINYFLILHPLFFVVQSLEANLVIKSDARIVL